MKRSSTLVLLFAMLVASAGVAQAGCGGMSAAEAAPAAAAVHHKLAASLQGKPVLARIHADWCAACKATQPTINALREKYGADVTFVDFDVTDAKTSAAAAEKAKKLGLSSYYETYKTATSTVAILNPSDGTTVAKFYNDSKAGDYESAIGTVRKQLQTK